MTTRTTKTTAQQKEARESRGSISTSEDEQKREKTEKNCGKKNQGGNVDGEVHFSLAYSARKPRRARSVCCLKNEHEDPEYAAQEAAVEPGVGAAEREHLKKKRWAAAVAVARDDGSWAPSRARVRARE